jgi:hypothetical protein
MNELTHSGAPIVCTLTAREREARGNRWRQLMRDANSRVAITDNGAVIRLDDVWARADVEELVSQERSCCSWMDLDLRDEGRELVLTMTADSHAGAAVIHKMVDSYFLHAWGR